ncbi:MAG TPA: hypothetical protein VGE23_01265 [Candidatus Paceibacterota bacterium]
MSHLDHIARSLNLLRYSYGSVILLVGLDKLFGTDFIVSWPQYISPLALSLLPVSVPVFLIIIGLIEIAVAVLMLTKWPRLTAYLSAAWLVLIALNLLAGGYIDIAAHDLLLAVGALALAELAAAKSKAHA